MYVRIICVYMDLTSNVSGRPYHGPIGIWSYITKWYINETKLNTSVGIIDGIYLNSAHGFSSKTPCQKSLKKK